MPYYKIRTRKTIITDIYVEADNELKAEAKATVGPIDKIKEKEGFIRIKTSEKPTRIVYVKEMDW